MPTVAFMGPLRYRSMTDSEVSTAMEDGALFTVDSPSPFETSRRTKQRQAASTSKSSANRASSMEDPSLVEFADSEQFQPPANDEAVEAFLHSAGHYPFAMMMQGSAPYIASHAGKAAVFHIPGDLLEDENTDKLLSDIALAWLLGMKIVIVAGSRYQDKLCNIDGMDHSHECQNTLKVTDKVMLRRVEEEAGFLRTEIERKLNRCLRVHGGVSSGPDGQAGNIVSGNFYTAQCFGVVRGEDFQFTGFTTGVNSEKIEQVLDNNDVVLLTTVGVSPMGELVNVNGYHLAATVASSLNAYKLIYMATEGSVLLKKGGNEPIQELPVSFAKSITRYHQVQVHNTGFATFEKARQTLQDPAAVELLLHLAWCAYALERGVTRAHIVNPSDGALLEELFTSKNGANTCMYHDDEDHFSDQDELHKSDWDDFFESAKANGETAAWFR